MRFATDRPIRLYAAAPGSDSAVHLASDIMTPTGDEVGSWRTIGIAPGSAETPLLTISNGGLQTLIVTAAGDWAVFERIGHHQQLAFAFAQMIDNQLVVHVAPAQIGNYELTFMAAGNSYRGKVAFQFLGPVREVPWTSQG